MSDGIQGFDVIVRNWLEEFQPERLEDHIETVDNDDGVTMEVKERSRAGEILVTRLKEAILLQ